MAVYTDKNKEGSRKAISTISIGQTENSSSFQLMDNRPASIAQKKQVESLANGVPAQRKPNNTGLPNQLKSGAENLSGQSMDDVKVHYNSAKPAQLNAHAYAQGTDIHIATGQEKHLPHEAWHVVQQKQGRVQPTMQMKGKVNINDDRRLEKEADVMGKKAAVQRMDKTDAFAPPDLNQQKAHGAGTVQAIMSVPAFKAATPGRVLGRSANIRAIDTSLHDYIVSPGPAKLANVAALIQVIDTYRGGNHAAAKITQANILRAEAIQEELLLNAIGAANGGLLDDLIARGGGAGNIPQLVHLANAATVAHALYLPGLVTDAGGAAGLATLTALIPAISAAAMPYLSGVIHAVGGFANHAHITNLVAETGPANFMNIPAYIHLAGGIANIPGLIALLHRNVGNPGRASQFLATINGNAARFVFLCTALPHFTALAAPAAAPIATVLIRAKYPLPANITGQYGHYNERHRAPTFAFNFQNINLTDGQTIWPYATTAADIVTYLEHVLLNLPPPVPGPPVPGATPNQPVGAGGMQARIRINNPTGINNYSISQFFPEAGTPGTFHFAGLEMIGIGKVLGHIP